MSQVPSGIFFHSKQRCEVYTRKPHSSLCHTFPSAFSGKIMRQMPRLQVVQQQIQLSLTQVSILQWKWSPSTAVSRGFQYNSVAGNTKQYFHNWSMDKKRQSPGTWQVTGLQGEVLTGFNWKACFLSTAHVCQLQMALTIFGKVVASPHTCFIQHQFNSIW